MLVEETMAVEQDGIVESMVDLEMLDMMMVQGADRREAMAIRIAIRKAIRPPFLDNPTQIIDNPGKIMYNPIQIMYNLENFPIIHNPNQIIHNLTWIMYHLIWIIHNLGDERFSEYT